MASAVRAPPPPRHASPVARMRADLRRERAATVPFPPGDTAFSMARTMRFTRDPLHLLLEAYGRHGPVFTLRIFHHNVVFMLGPAANHYMLVSHADNFVWRDGHMGDLMPFLGDGLLTVDGEFHRASRRAMLPMFHRERIAAAQALMIEEVDAALEPWHDGQRLDLYGWTRDLALRIALRALFGIDPDRHRGQVDAAREFEAALSFWSKDYIFQILRGPGSPWRRMVAARQRLDTIVYAEIARRRRRGERGEDLLSLLLDAQDGDGLHLTDRNLRDEVMTMLFAGHDTTTSTIAFLFHELGRHPDLVDAPDFDLALAVDETLRMYPPAWIGPRRALRPFALHDTMIPGGIPVEYSSWASHHLPDVWEAPESFRPQRFAADARARIPKGAYVPFGGGSRQCLGMRFGQAEIAVLASRILRRFRLEVEPGYRLQVRQSPTIGPRAGLPVIVRAAAPAAGTGTVPALAA